MFTENKYKKWYFSIIESAKAQNRKKKNGEYYESHHIIPQCVGGTETVLLTAKEHFICHMLLCKFTSNEIKLKMFYAFRALQMRGDNQKRYFNSRAYERIRFVFSENMSKKFSGQNNPMFGTISPTRGHKWYNDGTTEYKVSPSMKKPHWVAGRLSHTIQNFSNINSKKVIKNG